MNAANNRFAKHVISAFLAAVAWPLFAFIPAYPPIERASATIRPSGAADAFGYDGRGNQTTYTNAEGRVYAMAYDVMGRLTAATNALGIQAFRASYDSVGNLTNRVDANGAAVQSSYDSLNRLVSQRFSEDAQQKAIAYSYDAAGNMLSASNAAAEVSFTYDAMDRVASATSQYTLDGTSRVFANQWRRDPSGLVTNITYAAGKSVSQSYDANGRLVSVKDWLGHEWTFAYDTAGRPVSMSSPGNVASGWSYDAAGRLSGWNVGAIAGRAITRDAAGQRIRDDITAGPMPAPASPRQAANTVDAADRLVSASVRYGTNAPVVETFTYDPDGAMTNWISGETHLNLAYDVFGRVTTTKNYKLETDNYSYDALGNRIVTGGTLWIPDHADPMKRPLMECAAATGEVIRHYIWGPGRLLGFIGADGALTVAHCDEYGSVIALTDASGNAIHTANYGPHGEDWGTTGENPTPFAWLGGHGVRLMDDDTPLRLYITRHRVYSATLNRFLSPDPLGLAGGLNLYAYGEGNPLAYIDPLGLSAESVLGAAWDGFTEGLGGGLSILANTFTFGGTDYLGWTDSASYMGAEYDVSRALSTISRESLIAATTLGIGTAASAGSTTAQAVYKGVLVADAAFGGYQIGSGIGQMADGNYLAGGAQIIGGGLLFAGSLSGANMLANTTPAIVTSSSVTGDYITGYTRHGLNQAISRDEGRGVSAIAILDAVRNPQAITPQANGTIKYVGQNATVVLNQQGKVVTTWGAPRAP